MKKRTVVFLSALLLLSSLSSCAGGKNIVSIKAYEPDVQYLVGESFTPSKLSVTYDDGTTETIDITPDMLQGFDTSVAGTKTVLISYGGQMTSFEILVEDFYCDSLSLKEGSKTEYLRGDKYIDGEATILLHYTNGSIKEVSVTDDMIDNFDTSKVGESQVHLTYNHLTLTYPITILAPEILSIQFGEETKTTYFVGDEFEKIVCDITYENETESHVEITDSSLLSDFDTSTDGIKEVSFLHNGDTITLEILVKKAVKSLALKEAGDQIYEKNESFRPTEVIVTNEDDTTEEITIDGTMVEGFDSSKIGTGEVRFEYGHKILTFEITVPLINKVDYESSSDKRFRIEVEDENFVDLSEVKTISEGSSNLEDISEKGGSGMGLANVGSVKGNVIPILFYSSYEGTFDFEMNCQSASGKGGTDQNLADVMTMKANGEEVPVSGTAKAGGPGNWQNMVNWNIATLATGVPLKKGWNRIELTTRDTVTSDKRLPNIDYFNILVTKAE